MNEQIRELAEQAGFYVAMFDPGNKDNAMIEKFAELLVRECADIADNQEDYLTAKIIKQHFGVYV